MDGILNKIIVAASLAVMLAIGIPVGLMVYDVVQGQSPRQLAEKAQMEDTAEVGEDDGQPEDTVNEPGEQDRKEGEFLRFLSEPAAIFKFASSILNAPEEPDELATRPEVPPDPGPTPADVPEPTPEPAAVPESVPEKTVSTKKSGGTKSSTPSVSKSASAKAKQEPAQTAPARDPNEAPPMIEGMAEPPSIPAFPENIETVKIPSEVPITQEAPSIIADFNKPNSPGSAN